MVGLVLQDEQHDRVLEREELFANRKDCLSRRIQRPFESLLEEHFSHGAEFCLKKLVLEDGSFKVPCDPDTPRFGPVNALLIFDLCENDQSSCVNLYQHVSMQPMNSFFAMVFTQQTQC